MGDGRAGVSAELLGTSTDAFIGEPADEESQLGGELELPLAERDQFSEDAALMEEPTLVGATGAAQKKCVSGGIEGLDAAEEAAAAEAESKASPQPWWFQKGFFNASSREARSRSPRGRVSQVSTAASERDVEPPALLILDGM